MRQEIGIDENLVGRYKGGVVLEEHGRWCLWHFANYPVKWQLV